MADITNRKFLSELTRAQLLALAVQKANVTLNHALGLGDTQLRDLLETTKGLQDEVIG